MVGLPLMTGARRLADHGVDLPLEEITARLVASVVAETSERMKDPAYTQMAVGAFVEEQKHVSQYLSSRSARLGGANGVITLVFHAQILSECLRTERKAEVPLVPGYHGDEQDAAFLQHEADRIGYPVLLKASAGGGGKGMRVVERAVDFAPALASCQREAIISFGDAAVLIE